jgi:AICAR transformylase/IMP cyclohydrolase PurH
MPTALCSVSDTRGLLPLVLPLAARGWKFVSGGDTGKILHSAGVAYDPMDPIVFLPEEEGGRRYRTPNQKVLAAIAANRNNRDHMHSLSSYRVSPIDLVVWNLRPPETERGDAGGVEVLMTAAGNPKYVTILFGPDDYVRGAHWLEIGGLPLEQFNGLQAARTSDYVTAYSAKVAEFARATLGH